MASLQLFIFVILSLITIKDTEAFHLPVCRVNKRTTLSMTSYEVSETQKTIYNIPNSGWSSPQWNWGSAMGTGHDCAMKCRQIYNTKSDRKKLVDSLLNPIEYKSTHPEFEISFSEVTLILGLAWQNGRWDGSDGGPEGYGHVLSTMAKVQRYEEDDEVLSSLNFIADVCERFSTISRNSDELTKMKSIAIDIREKHDASKEEVFMTRRICAGMVLDNMGFINNGI